MPIRRTLEGVTFPVTDGKVSTTATAKKIWKAAAEAAGERAGTLAADLMAEKDWRHQYAKYVCSIVDLGASSPESALATAKAGLDCVAAEFGFTRGGERQNLAEAMAGGKEQESSIFTGTVLGEASTAPSLAIPNNSESEEAMALLKELSMKGTCEPDVFDSVSLMTKMSSEALQTLLQKHVFVLLGGTSEMGAYQPLIKLGATVVVVSRRGKKLAALVRAAKVNAAGTVLFPLSRAQTPEDKADDLAEIAGADVLVQAPELAAWLASLFPERTMVIASYIYLDGEAHVRAVVAMDAVLSTVTAARPAGRTSAVFLGSPATSHIITRDAWDDSRKRFEERSWFTSVMGAAFSFKRNDRPLVGELAVTDGLLVFQGPNYALAKTIQMWRAVLLHSAGTLVSFNMAPPCRTLSVIHSSAAKAAIEGMEKFEPNRAFRPAFASGVMCALMLFDLTEEGRSVASQIRNPLEITAGNAFHGGNIRCGFSSNSLGTAAFIAGKLGV